MRRVLRLRVAVCVLIEMRSIHVGLLLHGAWLGDDCALEEIGVIVTEDRA